MLRFCSAQLARSLTLAPRATFSEGAEFLTMVEKYFDNAGKHTNIRSDLLNFYKKADNVVKFNLTLTRGTSYLIKTMEPSKLSLPIVANTRPTSSPPREEPVTLRMSILLKLKPWLAL